MNENVKKISTDILKKLTKHNVKKSKSIVGIIELTCDIVEETSARLKKSGYNLSSKDKKELGLEIMKDVVINLKGKEIITDEKATSLLDYIEKSNTDVEEIMDDIISIFNDNKQIIKKSCNCFKRTKLIIRKFELI